MSAPTLTFEQWAEINTLYSSIYLVSTKCTYDVRVQQIIESIQRLHIVSPEDDPDDYPDITRRACATHYISDLPPRQEAQRLWSYWSCLYGERAENYQTEFMYDDNCPGYVYVLKMGDWYKIGRTKNILNRFPQISVKMPLPTRLWMIFYTPDMITTEEHAHQYFSPLRTNGEWFQLTQDALIDLYNAQPSLCGYFLPSTNEPEWRKDAPKVAQ